jgi:hypothetical protein
MRATMTALLRHVLVGLAALTIAGSTAIVSADAQSASGALTFGGRLSPVPIDLSMQDVIAGEGTATATLAGQTLTVSGTFKGLKSPATIARVHRSPNRGIRGPAIGELKVESAMSGTIAGSLTLSTEQVAELGRGLLYIQVHSERAPDGNLRGWLEGRGRK